MKNNQTSSNRAEKSKRGGKRPGAGRPRGSSARLYEDRFPQCAAALTLAVAKATDWQFLCAMHALGGDIDAAREALGLDWPSFDDQFGSAIKEYAARIAKPNSAATR